MAEGNRKRTSIIWSYFDEISEDSAKCKLCDRNFSFQGSTSNLRKHFNTQHPNVNLEKVKSSPSQVPDENEISKRSSNIEMAATKAPGYKKTSYLWVYFEQVSEYSARCTICKRILRFKGSTSNLKKHFNRHYNVDFEKGSSCLSQMSSESKIPKENLNFEIADIMDTRNKKCPIWLYFQRLGNYVRCKICRNVFPFNCIRKYNLKEHLKTQHLIVDLEKDKNQTPSNIDETSHVQEIKSVTSESHQSELQQEIDTDKTLNFRSYLKRKHADLLRRNENHKKLKLSPDEGNAVANAVSSKLSIPSIDYTQATFNEDITKFIVHSLLPSRVVENPHFKRIVENLQPHQTRKLEVPNKRVISKRLQELYEREWSSLKQTFESNNLNICLAATLYQTNNQTIFAVTSHWIDRDLLCRRSAAIACRKLKSKNISEEICEALDEIHSELGINHNNVIATISSSKSNFLSEAILECKEKEAEDVSEDNFENVSINKLSPTEIIDDHKRQPLHLHCCADILRSCAGHEVNEVIKNSHDLFTMHEEVMRKCNIFWRECGGKSSKIVNGILGHPLKRPDKKRWNTIFASLREIITIWPKYSDLCVLLNISDVLTQDEFTYIQEYVSCLTPCTEMWDIIQDDENNYYGIVLPSILALRKKLQVLCSREFKYFSTVLTKLLESVETKFHDFCTISTPAAEYAAVAAFSYPRFKNRWLPCIAPEYAKKLDTLFKDAVAQEINENTVELTVTELSDAKDDDFFDFGPSTSSKSQSQKPDDTKTLQADWDILQYFKDPRREIEMLNSYSAIRNVFLRYNTPLPCAEKSQSKSVIKNLLKPNKLSDKMFVLRANHRGIHT